MRASAPMWILEMLEVPRVSSTDSNRATRKRAEAIDQALTRVPTGSPRMARNKASGSHKLSTRIGS